MEADCWLRQQFSRNSLRSFLHRKGILIACFQRVISGQGGIRTPEVVRQLIYSQLPLATWVPAHHSSRYRLGSMSEFTSGKLANIQRVEPPIGFEPMTYRLQGGCSTN